MKAFVYILKCSDNTLYTGVTTDLKRRIREHNSDTSKTKYTKPRRPVTLIYTETAASLAKAKQREHQIKQLTRNEKLNLINND